jgi:hypothetical protein
MADNRLMLNLLSHDWQLALLCPGGSSLGYKQCTAFRLFTAIVYDGVNIMTAMYFPIDHASLRAFLR